MAEKKTKNNYEITVSLVGILVWPAVALLAAIAFWSPLNQTLNLVPSLLARSDLITIAGLSIKVSQDQKSIASKDVKNVLEKISGPEIERITLLGIGESTGTDPRHISALRDRNENFLKLGLVREATPEEIREESLKENKTFGYGIRTTPLGTETQQYLSSLVQAVVQVLVKQASN